MDFTMHHAAISAIDMAESIAFYEQFGFTVQPSRLLVSQLVSHVKQTPCLPVRVRKSSDQVHHT